MLHAIRNIFSFMLLIILILSTGCGHEPQASKPQQVTIAVQDLPNDESVARAWYVKELSKEFGVKVITLNYESSIPINNALATGNIDIAVIGTPSAAIGISNNLPYKVFWIHNVEGDNEALAVKNDSNINSIADLKDKRVAVSFGATTHYSLLFALQNAGLSVDDIRLFNMQPHEILDAWRQGLIDAAFVWQPALGELLNDGHILISSRQLHEQGITTADVGVVNKIFAQKRPDIVKKYVELQIRAHKLFKETPNQAASITSKTLNLTSAEALKQMNELIWVNVDDQLNERYLGTGEQKGQLAQTLFDTAHFLEHYSELHRAANLEVFQEALDPSYAESFVK